MNTTHNRYSRLMTKKMAQSHNKFVDNSSIRQVGTRDNVDDYNSNEVINIDQTGCFLINAESADPISPICSIENQVTTFNINRKKKWKKSRVLSGQNTLMTNNLLSDRSEAESDKAENLSIYSDVSEPAEKKTIDQIMPISSSLNKQNANNQMSNWVSFVESLSRPFLTKKLPEHKHARCLGTWAYSGPGFENEIIGKIEKDGIVNIKNSTMDYVWYAVQWDDLEGWVPASKLDLTTLRNLYNEFDLTSVVLKTKKKNVECETTSTIGLRIYPNMASHCQIILDAKVKLNVIMQRQQWYQVSWIINSKVYKGWIPVHWTQKVDLQAPTKDSISRNYSTNISSGCKMSPSKSILKETKMATESNSPRKHAPQKSLVILGMLITVLVLNLVCCFN